MRILMNFIPSRRSDGSFHISFLRDDARTPVGKRFIVSDLDALERLVDKMHGIGAHARTCVYNWGQGSEWINPSEQQCRFLGIATGDEKTGKTGA